MALAGRPDLKTIKNAKWRPENSIIEHFVGNEIINLHENCNFSA